jgi:hypothetical protein
MKNLIILLEMIGIVTQAVCNAWADEQPTAVGSNPAPEPQEVVGHYFRGNGLPYNLHLKLEQGGRFTAQWHSCLYKPGQSLGTWIVSGNRITLDPPVEGEMLRWPLSNLNVLRSKGQWILIPTDQRDRESYEKHGETRFSCFHRIDTPANVIGLWHHDNGLMGEFHTINILPRGDFAWIIRDEPLHAQDTFVGQWTIREGTVHFRFRSGESNLKRPLALKQDELIFSIHPDDLGNLSLTGDQEFLLHRN